MKRLLAILLLLPTLALANVWLVSQTILPDGRMLCVYSDGSTIISSFHNCPEFK